MTRQPGCLPTIIPDNAAIGLVQMSDASGNLSWQPITVPDLPAGTTSAAGVLQLDGTAADILPAGVQAAGANGKAADSGHVHPNYGWQSLYAAPAGATGETYPRVLATVGAAGALASGTLYVNAITLPAGIPVSNITLVTAATVKTGGTHGWYVLLDSALAVRAVTADQTDAATVWGTANTPYTLSVAASAYTTTYGGLYYIGVMVANTAGTNPLFVCATATAGGLASIVTMPPVLAGSSGTGLSTPPAAGATMTAVTPIANRNFYAYTS